MNLFKRRGVCATCRVHYELDSEEKLFPNSCETHRKPLRDEHRRRERVMQWVKYNFDLVAAYMDKALELQAEEQNILSGLAGHYNQQSQYGQQY